MNNALHHLLLVLLVVSPCYLVYGLLVRRPLIRQFRKQIDACRDQVELLLLAGKLKEDDAPLRILRKRCHNAHANLDRVDVTHTLLASSSEYSRQLNAAVVEESAVLAAGIPEVRELARRLDDIVLKSFAANSPLLVCASMLVLLGIVAFDGFKKTSARLARDAWTAIYIPELRRATA
jgi:hypothetical protein